MGIDKSAIPGLSPQEDLGPYGLRDPEVIRGKKKGPKPGPAAKLRRANEAWIHRNKYNISLGYLPKSFTHQLLGFGETGTEIRRRVITTMLEYIIAAYKRR